MQEYGKVPVDVKQCDTGVEKDGTVTMFEGNIQYQPLDFPIDVKRFAKKIAGLSYHDKERLAQCIVCAEDPFRCGITEEDEDENGMCLRFKGE